MSYKDRFLGYSLNIREKRLSPRVHEHQERLGEGLNGERMNDFLAGVLEHIAAESITAGLVAAGTWLLAVRTGFGLTLIQYRRFLRKQLRGMPFIYPDLQGDVLNDFVEVEIRYVDPSSFERGQAVRRVLHNQDLLRRSRRIVFLGDAGVGKTTYQRFAILSILHDPRTADFIYSAESLIPVYVPLKLIDTSGSHPVLRFLLNSHPLFKGLGGLDRIYRYGEARRIFLCLDGYDEIQADVDSSNLKHELSDLFGDSSSSRQASWENQTPRPSFWRCLFMTSRCQRTRRQLLDILSGDHIKILTHVLKGNRVWLSSRREFFDDNPIAISNQAPPDTCAVVEVGGVGQNRIRLTKNIFDKYRQRDSAYIDWLNEEYFISEIDRSPVHDLRSMSYNPLFLTVMCYIYVTEVGRHHRHDVDWISKRFEDLITDTVKLLVVDLDATKARDLPAAHRAGLLRRRNQYPDEKEAFLRFCAMELLCDGTGAFTLATLRKMVVTFFESEEWSSGEEIIRQTKSGWHGRADFALQLVYAGVFTTVSKIDDQTYYDFPHRRFRESLALHYVNVPKRYCRALLQVGRVHFEEFARLLRSSAAITQRDFQSAVLTHILHTATVSPDPEHDVPLSKNFVGMAPAAFDIAAEVRIWLRKIAEERAPVFELSEELLLRLRGDDQLIQLYTKSVIDSLSEREGERFALALRVLEILSTPTLLELIGRKWQEMAAVAAVRVRAAEVMFRVRTDLVAVWCAHSKSVERGFEDFLYGSVRAMAAGWTDEAGWRSLWSCLEDVERYQWFGFVTRFCRSQSVAFLTMFGLPAFPEWPGVIAEMVATDSGALYRARGEFYISTEAAVTALEQRKVELEKVFLTATIKIKVQRKDAIREIQFAIPPLVHEVVDGLKKALEARRGKRIDSWPGLVSRFHDRINDYRSKVTPRIQDDSVSATRTEVKFENLSEWILAPVISKVVVHADTLMKAQTSEAAWRYEPTELPDYFR